MEGVALTANCRLMDTLGLLNESDVRRLQTDIAPVLTDIGAEFIVHIVGSVPNRQFRDHAVTSRRMLSRDATNSLILVISVHDRHAEIATAPKYMDRFTGSASTGMLKQTFVPRMRQGRSTDAIASALKGMCDLLQGRGGVRRSIRKLKGPAIVLTLLSSLVALVVWILMQIHACRSCGGWCRIESTVTQEATYSSPGLRRSQYFCTRCGNQYTTESVIPELSSSSSSSDSSSSDSGSSSSGSDGGGGADW